MTAEERGDLFLAELDEIDDMTPEELLAEVKKLAGEENYLAVIASLALTVLGKPST